MVIGAVPKRYLENVFFKVIEGNSSFCARSAEETVSKLLHGIARDRIPRSRSFFISMREIHLTIDWTMCDTSSDFTNRLEKITVDVYDLQNVTVRTAWNDGSLILSLKN